MTHPLNLVEIAFPAYLLELTQRDEHRLCVVLEERTGLGPEEPLPGLPSLAGQAIVATSNDSVWEVVWTSVVSYAIRADAFAIEPADSGRNTISEVTTPTAFMDFVKVSARTDPRLASAMAGAPGRADLKLHHWRLQCNEFVLDGAAVTQPKIRRLRSAVVGATPTQH